MKRRRIQADSGGKTGYPTFIHPQYIRRAPDNNRWMAEQSIKFFSIPLVRWKFGELVRGRITGFAG